MPSEVFLPASVCHPKKEDLSRVKILMNLQVHLHKSVLKIPTTEIFNTDS